MDFTVQDEQDFFAKQERRAALDAIIYQQQIIAAFQKLREGDVEPILIKGWSIERFYPSDKKRVASDVDLCVSPTDYRKSQKIIKGLGFSPETIDLHKGLRHLDKLSWSDLFDNSRLIELHSTSIRVLRPEDSLRVACVHWLNDGGANKERLWDIYYLVKNRPADFDWQRCLDSNGGKRRRWILSAIAVTHRYLNLPVADLPFAKEIETILPAWFVPALEKEWNDKIKLVRLENFLLKRNWKSLGQQVKKRFAPNPIAASIATEAAFDETPRAPFQVADVILRFVIHFRRNTAAVFKLFQSHER